MSEFPYAHILSYWSKTISPITEWEAKNDQHTVFLITTDNEKRLIVKKVTHLPNHERLMSEYDVLHYLTEHDIPVSVPQLTDQGKFYIENMQEVFMIYSALPSTSHRVNPDERERYTAIGQALGRFHQVLNMYPKPITSWIMNLPAKLEDDVLPRLEQGLGTDQSNQLRQQILSIKQDMYTLWDQLPTQYIHGDFHGGNILFDGIQVTGFIDLDHLPLGSRMYDISYFLADEVKTRIDDNQRLASWLLSFKYLIMGYTQEITLTIQEQTALWYGMLITQLLFIDWFVKSEDNIQTIKNHRVFIWIYNHQEEINHAIQSINQSD